MSSGPVSQHSGRDGGPRPAGGWPEWMDDPAYLALRAAGEDLDDPDLDEDLKDDPPPEADEGELAAEADRITGELAREAVLLARLGLTGAMAAQAASAGGRRGPGMPGSAARVPGISVSRAAGFASAMPLDTAPGCLELARFAEDAAGPDDRYRDASDDELAGVICAWERSQAYISARQHAAVAEFIRRRAAPGSQPQGPARMPEDVDEFAAQELAAVLGETRAAAGHMLSLAHELEVNLPGTKAAFRAGILGERKAAIIAWATAVLDPDQARAAEAQVLDRAGTLTPPGLRAAIGRAVMEVAPTKARKRREHEAVRARVERWAEDSGNAGLAGRELPPAQVLAADQRVTAWAEELKRAGLDGGMDALRARAYLDILLGMDSRPPASEPGGTSTGTGTGTRTAQDRAAVRGPAQDLARARAQARAPVCPGGGPLAGVLPPGF